MAITREVVAWSSCMQSILNRVTQFAGVPRPVTLVGPTGVGKGMIAQLFHEQSGRPGELVGLPGGQLAKFPEGRGAVFPV